MECSCSDVVLVFTTHTQKKRSGKYKRQIREDKLFNQDQPSQVSFIVFLFFFSSSYISSNQTKPIVCLKKGLSNTGLWNYTGLGHDSCGPSALNNTLRILQSQMCSMIMAMGPKVLYSTGAIMAEDNPTGICICICFELFDSLFVKVNW